MANEDRSAPMTTKRPNLTPPTLARRRWVRALGIVAVSSAASAAMACSLLFPFDDLSGPRSNDASKPPDIIDPTGRFSLPEAGPEVPDATLLDASVRDANVPDAPTCTQCSTKFCTPGTADCDYAVFVTTATVSGDIGGVSAADSICAAEASTLGGTFRAWLSASTSASARVKPLVARPYRRRDGTLVALDHAELVGGNLRAPINLSADGTIISAYVWTGTSPFGATLNGYTCTGFTSNSGRGLYGASELTTTAWSYAGDTTCLNEFHLYCIQVEP
jgi:hypothetical protein